MPLSSAIGNVVWCVVAGCVALPVVCASAQERSSQVAPGVLEEIIVSAQKRSENAQEVPISVSAVSGVKLENFSAGRLSDYAGYVPGLSVQNNGGPGRARIIMRGLPALGSTAAVATYVDDAPFGSSSNWAAGSIRVLDMMPYELEQVEILRGPQGTLYGANTLGGLLKYVTRTPDLNDLQARVGLDTSDIKGASELGWNARGSVNVPLVEDRLGLRASYYREELPGYIDAPGLNAEDVNNVSQQGARASLLWQPSEQLSIKLGMMWQQVDADGIDFMTLRPIANASQPLSPLLGDLTQVRFVPVPYEEDFRHYALTLAWDLDWASLTSITTYAKSDRHEVIDHGATFGPFVGFFCAISAGCPAAQPGLGMFDSGIVTLNWDIDVEKRTQELRLASNSDGRLEWMIGAFYTKEEAMQAQIFDAFLLDRTPVPQIDMGYALLPTDYEERALFVNASYRLTDRFHLGAGVRRSSSDQNFVQVSRGILLLPTAPPGTITEAPADSSEDVTDYMISPRFQVNDDVMIYARVSTGFRPGGPNVVFPGLPSQFDSDSTTNYELGVKTEFLERRGLFNVALFHIDWDDIQTNVLDPASSISYTDNLGAARSRGVEIEVALRLLDGLSLGLSGTYTDATATEGAELLGGAEDDRLPYVSRWNAAATVGYEAGIASDWRWSTNLGVRYADTLYSALQSSPAALRQEAHSIADLSTTFSNERWSVRLFVNNLTDERVLIAPTPVANLFTGQRVFVNSAINQARRVGASIEVRF